MTRLNRLNLERCVVEDPNSIPLHISDSLQQLELDSSSISLLHRCDAFPNIEKISITSGVVSLNEIESIAVLRNLRVLDLRGAQIERVSLSAIRKLPTITTLIIFDSAVPKEDIEIDSGLYIEVHKCDGGSI